MDEIVLPAAVETAGMVETIDEKAAFGKSGRKKPENMLDALQRFLTIRYDFRYNLLTEQTEYRGKEMPDEEYAMVAQRDLNTFCLEARTGGINCWDKDVSRLLHSRKVENYHPFSALYEPLASMGRGGSCYSAGRCVYRVSRCG